jgi:hypothetical protein
MAKMDNPHHDDPIARTVAENQLADLLDETDEHETWFAASGSILGEFPSVEFERVSVDMPDGRVALRRLVITGPWEADPDGVR